MAVSISTIAKQATPAAETPIARDSWAWVLWRFVKREVNRIAERRRRRRDAALLLLMDDRMLADVGLCRCEIEHAIRYGRRPVDRSACNGCRPVVRPLH